MAEPKRLNRRSGTLSTKDHHDRPGVRGFEVVNWSGALYYSGGSCYGVDFWPIRLGGPGAVRLSVVVADLGAGAVDLTPEEPAGLVQAVVPGLQVVTAKQGRRWLNRDPDRELSLEPVCRVVFRLTWSSVARLDRSPALKPGRRERTVLRDELSRLFTVGERHRRLVARLTLALAMSAVVFIVGTLLIWTFENGQKGGDIHGLGDAAFFTSVQLLTISSSVANPLTSAGKIVDVILEAWAIFVVTAVAGSFATFFGSGDSG
jgi:hypothetical protein